MDYKRVNWDSVKEHGSQVLLIDINHPVGVKVLDDPDIKSLLSANKYIEHEPNNYGTTGKVFIYNIVEKALDNKDNLILFVESEMVHYDR
ncbi:MAG TPA: hypothetical protein VEY70_07005 [Metabacillus sp.]|nr:hypothetical protein [Metabacillus sp.]